MSPSSVFVANCRAALLFNEHAPRNSIFLNAQRTAVKREVTPEASSTRPALRRSTRPCTPTKIKKEEEDDSEDEDDDAADSEEDEEKDVERSGQPFVSSSESESCSAVVRLTRCAAVCLLCCSVLSFCVYRDALGFHPNPSVGKFSPSFHRTKHVLCVRAVEVEVSNPLVKHANSQAHGAPAAQVNTASNAKAVRERLALEANASTWEAMQRPAAGSASSAAAAAPAAGASLPWDRAERNVVRPFRMCQADRVIAARLRQWENAENGQRRSVASGKKNAPLSSSSHAAAAAAPSPLPQLSRLTAATGARLVPPMSLMRAVNGVAETAAAAVSPPRMQLAPQTLSLSAPLCLVQRLPALEPAPALAPAPLLPSLPFGSSLALHGQPPSVGNGLPALHPMSLIPLMPVHQAVADSAVSRDQAAASAPAVPVSSGVALAPSSSSSAPVGVCSSPPHMADAPSHANSDMDDEEEEEEKGHGTQTTDHTAGAQMDDEEERKSRDETVQANFTGTEETEATAVTDSSPPQLEHERQMGHAEDQSEELAAASSSSVAAYVSSSAASSSAASLSCADSAALPAWSVRCIDLTEDNVEEDRLAFKAAKEAYDKDVAAARAGGGHAQMTAAPGLSGSKRHYASGTTVVKPDPDASEAEAAAASGASLSSSKRVKLEPVSLPTTLKLFFSQVRLTDVQRDAVRAQLAPPEVHVDETDMLSLYSAFDTTSRENLQAQLQQGGLVHPNQLTPAQLNSWLMVMKLIAKQQGWNSTQKRKAQSDGFRATHRLRSLQMNPVAFPSSSHVQSSSSLELCPSIAGL